MGVSANPNTGFLLPLEERLALDEKVIFEPPSVIPIGFGFVIFKSKSSSASVKESLVISAEVILTSSSRTTFDQSLLQNAYNTAARLSLLFFLTARSYSG
jgi:hypothetical protein